LNVAVREIPSDEADQHFGWLSRFVGIDSPASNALIREILNWEPTHPTLPEDLRDGYYFQPLHQ
jgi:hypothetical protein